MQRPPIGVRLLSLASLALAITIVGCTVQNQSSSSGQSNTPRPAATGQASGSTGATGGASSPAPQSSPAAQAPTPPNAGKQWADPPQMAINPDRKYLATISTSMGDMEAELFAKEAPLTVNNFVFLAREGYFENIKFHRVIRNFMVQTGDPRGTGTGGPGYRFADELPTTLNYDRGTLAMANAGPNTNGSQFFIVHGETVSQSLPKNYSIFGKVTKGLDVLDKIATVPVRPSPQGEPSVPTTDVFITKVTIAES
jgi:cyclophilin family peptidyl-prolyl cis-trans isomerase